MRDFGAAAAVCGIQRCRRDLAINCRSLGSHRERISFCLGIPIL